MLRYFKELYNGIEYKYLLFWDNSPKAFGKITLIHGKFRKIEFLPLATDPSQSGGLAEGLSGLGYAGEGIDVIFFGPANIQLIRQIEDEDSDISDWIVEHKSELLPLGIPEEEVCWDYASYVANDNKYIGFLVGREKQITAAKAFANNYNIRINSFRPFLGLILEVTDIDSLLAAEADIPLQIPGTTTAIEYTSKGFLLSTKASNGFQGDSKQEFTLAKPRPGKSTSLEMLIYEKNKSDLLNKIYQWSFRYFRVAVNGIMVFSIIVFALVLYLAIQENGRIEKIEEMNFLDANLNALKNQTESLRKRLESYDSRRSPGSSSTQRPKPISGRTISMARSMTVSIFRTR